MEKKDFEALITSVLSLEEQKKELTADIKLAITNFAEAHNLNPKAVKNSVKAYKDWLKDQAEFYEVDREFAQIVNDAIYPKDDAEADSETETEETEEN